MSAHRLHQRRIVAQELARAADQVGLRRRGERPEEALIGVIGDALHPLGGHGEPLDEVALLGRGVAEEPIDARLHPPDREEEALLQREERVRDRRVRGPAAREPEAGGERDADVLAGGEDRLVIRRALRSEQGQRRRRPQYAPHDADDRRAGRIHVLEIEDVGGERAAKLVHVEAGLAIGRYRPRRLRGLESASRQDQAARHEPIPSKERAGMARPPARGCAGVPPRDGTAQPPLLLNRRSFDSRSHLVPDKPGWRALRS